MYLHPKLKGQIDLSRLTRIYQWKEPELDENSVFERLRSYREHDSLMMYSVESYIDAWINSLPSSIIERCEVKEGFWGIKQEGRVEVILRLAKIMNEIESLIETDRRFEAYEIEVKALSKFDISFHEWIKLQPDENQSQNNNVMYIIPDEPLDLS
jgi:hypothetical protein